MTEKPIVLIALGGNALVEKGQRDTAEEQFENLKIPIRQIAQLSKKYKVVITHGNGPQLGNLRLQQESCDKVPKMPLEIIVAQTQGQIGYMIESSLDTALMEMEINDKYFVTLITYVVVDKNDSAFQHPTKPIGPVYDEEEAGKIPYRVMKTYKGYRRVVASPKPVTIVGKREIKKLLEMDFLVICCGAGGIPVIRQGRKFSGVEAVIDKDFASTKLAQEVNADIFVIVTDIHGAAIHYGTPDQKVLRKISLSKMKQYIQEGHFAVGSMRPKVEAITQFFQNTRNRGIICHLNNIEKAIDGESGTEIIPG